MTRRRSAATADEDAELRALSQQAEQARQELGDTIAALTGKVAGLGRPGYARIAVIVIPVALVAAGAALYAMRRRANAS